MAHRELVPIDASGISDVTDVLGPERGALVELLRGFVAEEWDRPTECPAYPVKGIAAHILGDDLSLLSRQRDGAVQGLILVAEKMPGADFRGLLNAFNDQWVEAARFLSGPMLIELLEWSGEWSSAYYGHVDPMLPGEPVLLFGPPPGEGSPFWQAIAREYLERWTHQSQIRRAVGLSSLDDQPFLEVGTRIVAGVVGEPVLVPDEPGGEWAIGPLGLGPTSQAAAILTLAHTEPEVTALVDGPPDLVAQFATRVSRRTDG